MRQKGVADGDLLLVRERHCRRTDLAHVFFASCLPEGIVQVGNSDLDLRDRASVPAVDLLLARREAPESDASPNSLRAAAATFHRVSYVEPFFFGHRESSRIPEHPERDPIATHIERSNVTHRP